MPYKDPNKRRQASKKAMQRKRNVNPSTLTPDVNPNTIGTVNPVPLVFIVTPEGAKSKVPENYGLENCVCKDCQLNRASGNKRIVNHGKYKDVSQLADNEINRVSLPGDIDYQEEVICADCKDELCPTE